MESKTTTKVFMDWAKNELFGSDDSNPVNLSSVHKVKGGEADTAILLRSVKHEDKIRDIFMHPSGEKSAENMSEELCILYVALTRSKIRNISAYAELDGMEEDDDNEQESDDNEIIFDEDWECYRSVKTGKEIDRDELYVTAERITWDSTVLAEDLNMPKNALVPFRLEYDDDAIMDYLSSEYAWPIRNIGAINCDVVWKPKTSEIAKCCECNKAIDTEIQNASCPDCEGFLCNEYVPERGPNGGKLTNAGQIDEYRSCGEFLGKTLEDLMDKEGRKKKEFIRQCKGCYESEHGTMGKSSIYRTNFTKN